MFVQKVMPIFGAMMSVSFFLPPVFRSFIGRVIRNFTKSFFIFFHSPIMFSTDLMNPLLHQIFYQKYKIHLEVPLSQKIQIKLQQKQCFSYPMSSLKDLVTKKKKKGNIHWLRNRSYEALYMTWEDINVSS